ncbi:MAG: hypothetical protein H0V27_00260 [Pyrinomonadaceae bacterium]|nr:hypothetical protein [Pyrinomonadaceae bacterium]
MQQYGGGANAAQAPAQVDNDFDRLAQSAPNSAVADGLAAAFRSEQTPAFGQMVSQLFNNSNGQQRASLLNTLIAAVGPTLVAQLLSKRGGGLSGLAGLLGSGQREVTPEEAEQIPPDAVQEIAAYAEKKDPTVIDQISDFYSQHPTLVKVLGAAALTIALSQIAQRQQRGA